MFKLIHHRAFGHALESARRTIAAVGDSSDPACLPIVGPSGSGKTMVLELIMEEYATSRPPEGLKIPVVRAKTPSHPTINGLAKLIIETAGDGVPVRGSETDRTQRLLKLLHNAEARVLALDDAQHIVDHCSPRDQLRIADWLKIIADEAGVGLMLVGLPRVCALIDCNEQLARRFNAPAELPRFSWEDERDRRDFLTVVGQLQEALSRFDMPQLDSEEMGFRCYAACGGLLGYLTKFLREAVRRAECARVKTIDLDTLAEAHAFAVYRKVRGLPSPFDPALELVADAETMACINEMGDQIFDDLPDVEAAWRARGRRTRAAAVR